MGDRANVVMHYEEGKPEIFLYSHWQGPSLAIIVKDAIASKAGRGRWDDPAYLARIIFCKMVGKDEVDGETGFGIDVSPPDNSYPYIHVLTAEKKIRIGKREWTFEQYTKQGDSLLESVMMVENAG